MCPTLLTCSFVTFDRKIKRLDLNVVISRSRLSTCSCIPIVVPRFRLSYVIGLAPVGVQDQCLSDQLRSYVFQ